MTRLFKMVKGVCLAGQAAVLLSTSAYSVEAESDVDQGDFSTAGGTYCKDAVTGEVFYTG